MHFIASYQSTNASIISKAASQALTPALLQHCSTQLLVALSYCKTISCERGGGGGARSGEDSGTTRVRYIATQEVLFLTTLHCAIARSTDILSASFGRDVDILQSLSTHYSTTLRQTRHMTLQNAAELLQSISRKERIDIERDAQDWLQVKLAVLETTRVVLEAGYFARLEAIGEGKLEEEERSSTMAALCHVLSPLLDAEVDAAAIVASSSSKIHLVDQTLLEDMEHYCNLSQRILQACGRTDAGGRDISRRIAALSKRTRTSLDGLDLLQHAVRSDSSSTSSPSRSDDDRILSIAISDVQDLFPSLSATFLRRALSHPLYSNFSTSPSSSSTSSSLSMVKERLIADLLESSLPADLKREMEGGSDAVTSDSASTLASRSVFSDRFDVKNLRKGGSHSDSVVSSVLDSSIKDSIISRVAMPLSDEEGDDYDYHDDDEGGEAFLEDFDDLATGRRRIFEEGNDRDDGYDDNYHGDGDDARERMGGSRRHTPLQSASSFSPAVLTHLISTYSTTPSLFDRAHVVRKAKDRIRLREATGLGDEAIEEWALRWKRDPKKDQITNLHELDSFEGNHHAATLPVVGGSSIQQSNSRDTKRGGRGGARGTRGRGDGGRFESNRRQRGSDRKMPKLA